MSAIKSFIYGFYLFKKYYCLLKVILADFYKSFKKVYLFYCLKNINIIYILIKFYGYSK